MPSELLHADEAGIVRTIAVLKAGGLVAIPTDTVYGVAARLDAELAVARLYFAKIRPLDRPIPVLVAGLEGLEGVVAEIPEAAKRLFDAFWPGPLTLVLPRGPAVSDAVSAGLPSVGVRWPANAVAEAVIAGCGGALAVTSANLSGAASARDASEVLAQLEGRIELVLDGGPANLGVASSVVDLTQTPPVVLRAGALDFVELRELIPDLAPSKPEAGAF
jgi:L-threonylcarbamoyladenylate synthase